MHPTVTEHDYRFPRRPDQVSKRDAVMDDQSSGRSPTSSARLGLDDDLLGSALFPSRDAGPPTVDELRQEDPLAAQVWKFFAKTKQQLPNQQRMENLTWRMMALSMRKRTLDEQK